MKNKTFWLVLFLVALGTWLRLIFIDKPDGLWNDEYVSYYVASIPYGKTFWQAVFAQCHMPLYYFYLKFFMHFFGNSDLVLRLTSVLPGVLSIVSMYFVGKELKDEKAGILCAAITSISSFLIYFSQEVRFYSLLFLFSSLVLLFTLKLLKEQKLSNIFGFVIFSLLVIFTHTLGFVFVIFNLVFVTLYLQKKSRVALWLPLVLLSLIGMPLLFSILTTHTQSQFWSSFSIAKLGFLVTDYFSPILTNIVSAPDNFLYDFSLKFIIFALIPSIIVIMGIAKTIQGTGNGERETAEANSKQQIADSEGERATYNENSPSQLLSSSAKSPFTIYHSLFTVCVAYILTLVIASISGKLVFVTKYTIEIYPILIALVAFGLLQFEKTWRQGLIFLFCFLNLFYILLSHVSAPKLHRSEGHKIVAELIQNAKLNKNDMILLTYYTPDRFEKYFDFSDYRVLSINKANAGEYLGVSSKVDFKKFDYKIFEGKFKNEVVNQLKPNQKLAVVILDDVAVYSPMQMYQILTNYDLYKKAPYMFMVFSGLKNEIINQPFKTLQLRRMESKGSWSIFTFEKQ